MATKSISIPRILAALAVAFAATTAPVAAQEPAPPSTAPEDPAAAAPTATAPPTEPTPVPKIFTAGAVLDAGAVARGDKVTAEFFVENRGDAPLEIKRVEPACGCTVASFDRTIEPGATGKVRAVVDTTDFAGPIAKSVTVLSNDPATPRLVLTVKVDVRTHVTASPSYVRLIHTRTQAPPKTALTVASADKEDFVVTEVESPHEWVTATVREAKPEERLPEISGRQWRIEVALAADSPVGPLRDFLEVRTNHPGQRELQVPLSGVVRPVLHLTPSAAAFGELVLAGQAREVGLTLINFGAEPVEVRAVSTDVPGAETTLQVVEEGKRWRIVVRLTPEIAKGKVDGELVIETTSPELPRIEVPVSGRIG
jgi:hypothetical protein